MIPSPFDVPLELAALRPGDVAVLHVRADVPRDVLERFALDWHLHVYRPAGVRAVFLDAAVDRLEVRRELVQDGGGI